MGVGWLGLTWVGYPAWLVVLSKVAPRPVRLAVGASPVSRVVIVCVAKNERQHIARRLRELAALERGGLELSVVLVDDGSTDGMAEAAREVIGRDDQPGGGGLGIDVTIVSGGPGKANGIVRGIEVATTQGPDVVVFCDVRQHIASGALLRLLEPFGDPAVGACSGVVTKSSTTVGGLYWRYESWVRRLESETGSTIGATGPWHALRASMLPSEGGPELDGLLLDDVWLPMQAAMRGARVVVASGAVVQDVEHLGAVERTKKARTLTGNLQLLRRWPDLLSPRQNPLFSRYLMHKVMRLGTPWAVGAMMLAPVVGTLTPGPLQPMWMALLAAELGLVMTPKGREATAVILAAAESWWRFARGDYRW